MSDQDRISPYNIDQISDENKEKYQFGDNKLIQHLIPWTNIRRNVLVNSKENYKFDLGVKGLTFQLTL